MADIVEKVTIGLAGLVLLTVAVLIISGFISPIADTVAGEKVISNRFIDRAALIDVNVNESGVNASEMLIKWDMSDVTKGSVSGFNVTNATICLTNTTAFNPTVPLLSYVANQTWTEGETAGSYNGITNGTPVAGVFVGEGNFCVDVTTLLVQSDNNFSIRIEDIDFIVNTASVIENGALLFIGNATNATSALYFDSNTGTVAPVLSVYWQFEQSSTTNTLLDLIPTLFVVGLLMFIFGIFLIFIIKFVQQN